MTKEQEKLLENEIDEFIKQFADPNQYLPKSKDWKTFIFRLLEAKDAEHEEQMREAEIDAMYRCLGALGSTTNFLELDLNGRADYYTEAKRLIREMIKAEQSNLKKYGVDEEDKDKN